MCGGYEAAKDGGVFGVSVWFARGVLQAVVTKFAVSEGVTGGVS